VHAGRLFRGDADCRAANRGSYNGSSADLHRDRIARRDAEQRTGYRIRRTGNRNRRAGHPERSAVGQP
jgi:hypothetical protein